jgi:O-antigen ligase
MLFLVAIVMLVAVIPFIVPVARFLWRRPAWTVVLTIALVAVPFRTGPEAQASAHVTLADLGALLCVGVVALRALFERDRTRLRSWVVVPMFAFTVAVFAATLFSPEHRPYFGAVRYLELFVVVPMCVFLALRTRRDEHIVMGALLGLGVFEGAIGVYQALTNTGAGYGAKAVRAVGTFGAYDIMGLAKVVSYAIIVAVAWALAGRGRMRRYGIVAGIFLFFPLVMSLSRGSWLATAIAVIVLLVAYEPRRGLALVVVGGVTLACVIALQGPNSTQRKRLDSLIGVASSPDNSVRDRYELWSAAAEIWQHNPVTGVGPKAFADYKARYAGLGFSDRSDVSDGEGYRVVQLLTPHSLYLLLLAELGGVGAFAFLLLVGSLTGTSLRSVLRAQGRLHDRRLALFSLGTMLVFAITSLYGDLGGPTTLLESVLLGVVLANVNRVDRRVREPVLAS